jgi:hypothetical protein
MDVATAAGIAGASVTRIDANWGWAKPGFHPLPTLSKTPQTRVGGG